jgi:tripartite-type tricarboxylate transporter receptor subunit TctC
MSFARTLRAFVLTAATLLSANVVAQAYPVRPVRIIVPYAVGTATDAAARMLAQRLAVVWGRGVTVDALPGAGGAVGTQVLYKSAGDGYTLGVIAGAHAINAALYKNLPYDSLKDFKPVMNLAYTPLVIVINPALPPKTVAELIAYSKAAAKPLNYGSGGTGSAPHLGMEYFLQMAGIRITHAPYKNLGQMGTDLMSGQIDLSMVAPTTFLSNIRVGKLRALGITSNTRSPLLPDVPPVSDSVPGYDVKVWIGLVVPNGTPEDIIARITTDATAIMRSDEMAKALQQQGIEPDPMPAGPFWQQVTAEVARWTKIVKEAGVTPE